VIGVVNCTPDSFSGDGLLTEEEAVKQGLQMVEEGADVLDVGGESTRPGAEPVGAEEQRRRIIPVIKVLARRADVPLSVDTSSAEVAVAAMDAGASMVNDVRGLEDDALLAEVAARPGVWVVVTHSRRASAPLRGRPGDTGLVDAVADALATRLADVLEAGVRRDRVLLDPGIGFGKAPRQSLALLRHLGRLGAHQGFADLPVMVGTSRKEFIGETLGLPVNQRLEGTLATLALAVAGGADVVRVHDVQAAVRCCRMADAIVRGSG